MQNEIPISESLGLIAAGVGLLGLVGLFILAAWLWEPRRGPVDSAANLPPAARDSQPQEAATSEQVGSLDRSETVHEHLRSREKGPSGWLHLGEEWLEGLAGLCLLGGAAGLLVLVGNSLWLLCTGTVRQWAVLPALGVCALVLVSGFCLRLGDLWARWVAFGITLAGFLVLGGWAIADLTRPSLEGLGNLDAILQCGKLAVGVFLVLVGVHAKRRATKGEP